MGPVTGTLSPGVAATLYNVSGVKGEQIHLHPTSTPGAGSWALYGSGNQSIASAGLNSDLTATFPTTGTYVLALFGASTTSPISFSFIAHLVNTATEPIPTTATVSGATTYTYNAFSEVTSETDPLGRVTDYTYDANGNLLTETQVVVQGREQSGDDLHL